MDELGEVMTKISASLLAADFARMGEEVARAEAAGVDSFHVDFMDGHYVPNLALAPDHLTTLTPQTDLPMQVHLEIANPDPFLDQFKPFPVDLIILQWDTCPDPDKSITRVRSWNARVGMGLLPLAPYDPIIPYFDQLDLLLLLGVQPGFGGQTMVSGVQAWVRSIARERDLYAPGLPLAIDGGVKADNAADLIHAGADVLIIGSGLFTAADMKSLVTTLKKIPR